MIGVETKGSFLAGNSEVIATLSSGFLKGIGDNSALIATEENIKKADKTSPKAALALFGGNVSMIK